MLDNVSYTFKQKVVFQHFFSNYRCLQCGADTVRGDEARIRMGAISFHACHVFSFRFFSEDFVI